MNETNELDGRTPAAPGPSVPVETEKAERSRGDDEYMTVAEHRRRMKGFQEAETRRQSKQESRLATFERAFAEARERTKDLDADWTTHESGKGGFWSMTSHNTRMIITTLVLERDEARVAMTLLRGLVLQNASYEDAAPGMAIVEAQRLVELFREAEDFLAATREQTPESTTHDAETSVSESINTIDGDTE